MSLGFQGNVTNEAQNGAVGTRHSQNDSGKSNPTGGCEYHWTHPDNFQAVLSKRNVALQVVQLAFFGLATDRDAVLFYLDGLQDDIVN